MRKVQLALLALTVALPMGASRPQTLPPSPPPATPPPFTGELSVMTYNIHGAPWPVAWDRPAKLASIATTLRVLRREGRNPHIVVLQEAFTQEAQSVGRAAGYRYIADGPSADMAGAAIPGDAHLAPSSSDFWMKGEGIGKYVGSGLQILSDYPVMEVHRVAYPASACAGYDCLANKGALMAAIRLPGYPVPIDVVTTHLNSRHASKVSDGRSFRAFRLQIACLTDFIRKRHSPERTLIVAGDFNVGRVMARRTALLTDAGTRWLANGDVLRDAYGAADKARIVLSSDALFSRNRAKDWVFYAPGQATDMNLLKIDVPFGHAANGSMLSDHVGYTAIFRLSHRSPTVTSFARSKASAFADARA
ncbi:endonuclease/exonuclease/phosphatase family protein [Sphingobium sp. CFD-1]|uniref:endonuclease/exonuclease/phosphatase family protein n=1 Tax=Sphingobium sp. CFD-1 TaxID=2878545 RepID=UPI00214C2438|nr:endonuclease/exonuclease/phosphatase family protein [Sphingobium sp. CFD-1]